MYLANHNLNMYTFRILDVRGLDMIKYGNVWTRLIRSSETSGHDYSWNVAYSPNPATKIWIEDDERTEIFNEELRIFQELADQK